MDRDTIIDGLRMTMDLCVFDPSTGEEIDPDMLNDINRATYDACKGALEILEQLPPAQPEPHWIPVTERLPEIGEYVLCMIRQQYRGQFHVCHYVDKDKYHDHPYFDWWHNGFPDVVAWMPLPKPYKGEVTE